MILIFIFSQYLIVFSISKNALGVMHWKKARNKKEFVAGKEKSLKSSTRLEPDIP